MTIDSAQSIVPIFDPARLRLARQMRGMRKSDVARLLHVTPAAITQIENGSTKPSAKLLVQASLALAFPIAFFAADPQRAAPVTGQAFFRSLRSARQIDRDQAEAHAGVIYDFARIIERSVILPDVRFPDLRVSDQASRELVEDRARQLRDYWGVLSGPIPNVVRLLEANGAIVTRHAMGRHELDAFSRWFDSRPVVVLGSDKGDLARQRFDAAHELGHLVLHGEAEPGTHITEHQAHAFAAAFLMPRDEILPKLPRRLDWKRLAVLKQEWGVSIAALLFRSRELGAITDATYRRAMVKMSQWGWRFREPSPLVGNESPTLLSRALELAQTAHPDGNKLAEEYGFPPDIVAEVGLPPISKPRIVVSSDFD